MNVWMRLWRRSWCGRWSGRRRGGRSWRRGWCRSSQLHGDETGAVQAGVGKECRITGRIEFLDRIVARVGRVEIAAAVEGKTDRAAQAGVGEALVQEGGERQSGFPLYREAVSRVHAFAAGGHGTNFGRQHPSNRRR